jgi:hypothetical protein
MSEPLVLPLVPRLPGYISKEDLPDHVYALSPANAAQPTLVRWLCRACVRSLTTRSKTEVADGTVVGFAKAFLSTSFCSRKGSYEPCSGCRTSKVGACSEVSIRCLTDAWPLTDVYVDRA